MKWLDRIFKKGEPVEQPTQVPDGWFPGMTKPYNNEIADSCAVCGESSSRNMDGQAYCQSHLGNALGIRDERIKNYQKHGKSLPDNMPESILEFMRELYAEGKV